MTDIPTIAKGLSEAREEFVLYLRDEFGDEAADCREDGILRGREDGDCFIAGYLAAVRAYLMENGG